MENNSLSLNAIEGCKIEILSLKILSNNIPVFLENHDEIVFPIKASRKANGTIVEEYVPKQSKFYKDSKLDKGDNISGKNLWGFSASPVRRINIGGKGRTGRHTGQNTSIDGNFSFLSVVSSWRGRNLLTHPRDFFLKSY